MALSIARQRCAPVCRVSLRLRPRAASLVVCRLLLARILTSDATVLGALSSQDKRSTALRSRGNNSEAFPADCILDYVVPEKDGASSLLHVKTSRTFVDYLDPWWNKEKVLRFEGPTDSQPYKLAPSHINRCGVFASRKVAIGEAIDRVWVPDDDHYLPSVLQTFVAHITPWYGSALNHCPGDRANVAVEERSDRSVWGVATRDIEEGEEMTVNYNDAFWKFPLRVVPASPFWSCPSH